MKLSIVNGEKRYKAQTILDEVTVTFETGHIYGLQGINGSGKTVLLKILAGYTSLDKGQVFQDKREISVQQYIQNAGIIIEQVSFLPHLTLVENLKLLQTIDYSIKNESINWWVNYYCLTEFNETKYKHLSLGTKQKMALIQAFISNPEILFLDEPLNALDEKSVALTKKYLLENKENRLVIMTSHISQDISDLCDCCLYLENGNLIKRGNY